MTSRIQRMCSAGASRPPPPRSSSSRIKTINATTLDLPPFEPTLFGPAGIKRLFEKRPPPGGLPVPGPCAAGLAALHERAPARSEERRVGKECRLPACGQHYQKHSELLLHQTA